MANTRSTANRNSTVAAPPPSSQPQKMKSTAGEPDMDASEYIDVEAEHDSDSGAISAGAEGEGDNDDVEDSSNEWVVSDGVDPSIYDSDTLSEADEFPPTLTGEPMAVEGATAGNDELEYIGSIDVQGRSLVSDVPVTDNTDVSMSDGGDGLNHDVNARGPDYDDAHMVQDKEIAVDETMGDVTAVADLFHAVKGKRPVRSGNVSNDKSGKKKASSADKESGMRKKPQPKQTELQLTREEPQRSLEKPFVRIDGKHVTGKLLERLIKFTEFANDYESMFYVGNEPADLEWSTVKVGPSRLVVKGQATAVRLLVVGQITWNGALPTGRGSDGPEYPTRPKMAIKCLRDADTLRFKSLIKDHSNSKKTLELQNMSNVTAYTDSGERRRGTDEMVGVPFTEIFNAEKKYAANKNGMERLHPNQLMRNDIIMLEVSIARYFDITGKKPDWTSTRVYFRLEAISLLLRYDSKSVEDKPPSVSFVSRRVPMDETM